MECQVQSVYDAGDPVEIVFENRPEGVCKVIIRIVSNRRPLRSAKEIASDIQQLYSEQRLRGIFMHGRCDEWVKPRPKTNPYQWAQPSRESGPRDLNPFHFITFLARRIDTFYADALKVYCEERHLSWTVTAR